MATQHYISRIICYVTLCFVLGFEAQAQVQKVRPRRGVGIRRPPERRKPPIAVAPPVSHVLIETSAPIANLLQRAEDAILREDWKLAIDSLQRVIDAPDGSLISPNKDERASSTIYQSASRYAAGRIASFSKEGIAAYRLLYDGKAKRLYDESIASHNADGLWTIARRYTGTSYGDDALETLASWALDANRPEQALRLLHDLRTLVQDQDQDRSRIAMMEAVAQVMIGAVDSAHKTMTPHIPVLTPSPSDQSWHQLVVHTASTQATDRYAVEEPSYQSWPMSNGSLVGNGRLPAVSPEITSTAPWRYELDVRNFRLPLGQGSDLGHERLAFPFYRFAIADHRMILRTRRGCVALDADDLSMLWQSPSPKRRLSASLESSASTDGQRKGSYEPVAGEIVVEGQYVYTVQRALPGWMKSDDILAPPRVAPPSPRDRKDGGETSSLVARHVDTGDMAWVRGGDGDPLDPLGEVRFRAVPIIVDGLLWVPYERQRELFLGVLNPVDGTDISRIFLCSNQSSKRRVTTPLTPVHQSGVIYLASEHGAFFAIDVAGRDVIWAHRLNTYLSLANSGSLSWETGSPAVARGLVFFPSLLDGKLYALDMLDGSMVWSKAVDQAAFITAADAKYVWLAGRTMTCLTSGTGDEVWTRELPFTQTGRATVVGDSMMIPTVHSVLALDAYSGELIKDYTLSEKQHPLGDIVSFRSSLYSVDPTFVRRFPDLSQMYPASKARLSDHPEDVRTRLRLARLEILRGQPEAAISLLESKDQRYEGTNRQMRARTLVDAWLSMAGEGKGERGQMARALRQAEKQATTNAQKIRVALAKSRWQRTDHDIIGAARTIWQAAASLPDDKNVELGGLAKGAAQVVLRRALLDINQDMDAASRDQLAQYTDKELRAILEGNMADERLSRLLARSLRAIAELGVPPATAQRAMLAYAKRNLLRGRYELAERDFVDCAGMEASPSLSRVALMYLINMHTHVLHSPSRVIDPWVTALKRFSPHEEVPSAYEWFDMFGSRPARATTLGAWLTQNRAVGGESLADGKVSPPQRSANQVGNSWSFMAQSSNENAGRLGFRRGHTDEIGFVPALVFMREDRLAALHPSTGRVLWQADIRFPEVFPNSSFLRRNSQRSRANDQGPRRSFVVDGQVVVVVSREGLSGIGLITGKRLWVRPFDLLPLVTHPAKRDSTIAAQGGMMASMHTGGRLTLMRTADGSIVWERDMYGETVQHIWLTDTRVITADRQMQRVHIIDRADGKLIRQVLFGQPDADSDLVSLVIVGGSLYGPTHSTRVDGLLGVDLVSGEDVWRRDLDRPLVQLFALNEHMLGVALLGGGGYVIDAAMGYESTSFFFENVPRVKGLHLVDDSLIAIYAERMNRRPIMGMKALDVATGKPRWSRQDLAVVKGNTASIQVMGNNIFTVLETVTSPRAHDTRYTVAAIDAATGADDGWREELPKMGPQSSYRFDGDLDVRPGIVLVGTTSTIYGFTLTENDLRANEIEVEQ